MVGGVVHCAGKAGVESGLLGAGACWPKAQVHDLGAVINRIFDGAEGISGSAAAACAEYFDGQQAGIWSHA